MRSHRRARAAVLALALVAALAGCIRVDMSVTVHEDDTLSGDYVLAMSREMLEMSGESVDDLLGEGGVPQEALGLDELPSGATLAQEPYEDEDWVGQRVTFTGVPIAEFSGEDLSLTHADGRFTLDGELPAVAEGMPGVAGGEVRLAFTFPGEVLETTGEVDPDDARTVVFSGDGSQALTVRAVAEDTPAGPAWLTIALLGGGGLLLVAAVAVVVVLLVRRRRAAAAPFPGQQPFPVYAGVPTPQPGAYPAAPGAPAGTPFAHAPQHAPLPPYVAPAPPAPPAGQAWSDQQGTHAWQPDPPAGLAPGAVPQQPQTYQPPAQPPYPPTV